MKLTPLLTSAFAASALFLTSCGDDKADAGKTTTTSTTSTGGGAAVSEKDALESFKKASTEVNALIAEGKAAGDPISGMPKMIAALEKMKSIKTDGLPADLKESFTAAKEGMGTMLAKFKEIPTDPTQIEGFLKKLMSDPATTKLMESGKAATTKFKAIATKYGIEVSE